METTQRYTDEQIAEGFRNPETAKSMLHYVLVELNFYRDGEDFLREKAGATQVKDLLHKATVGFYEAMVKGRMKPDGSVRGYFFGVLKNTRLAAYREHSTYTGHIEKFGQGQAGSEPMPEIELVETNSFSDARLANWQKLSEMCRKLLKLRQQNLSFKVIAQRLGYNNEHTAKAKKNNCKNQLKKFNLASGIA